MFILKNCGKNKDAYLSVLLGYLKIRTGKVHLAAFLWLPWCLSFFLPQDYPCPELGRSSLLDRLFFYSATSECIPMPCKCLLLFGTLKPGTPGAPSLPRSAPKPGALGFQDLCRCHSHQYRSCALLVSKEK